MIWTLLPLLRQSPDAFRPGLAEEMNKAAVRLAEKQSAEAAKRQQYTGSLISLTSDPV